MTITVPLWVLVPVSLIIVSIIALRLSQPKGDYDFFSPFIGLVLMGGAVLFWIAFFLGRWL